MKQILINATEPEQIRIAIVEQNKKEQDKKAQDKKAQDKKRLVKLFIENLSAPSTRDNIYRGVINQIVPNIAAIFIDIGLERHGFLQYNREQQLYQPETQIISSAGKRKPAKGDGVIVQVKREAQNEKGVGLTNKISIRGEYVTLFPGQPEAPKLSSSFNDQDEIEAVIKSLNIKPDMGYAILNRAKKASSQAFKEDFLGLLNTWDSVITAAKKQNGPALIYQENDFVYRVLRQHTNLTVKSIVADTQESYEKALQIIKIILPNEPIQVKLHDNLQPIFHHYSIETQISTALNRHVELSSGAEVVIDKTEAGVFIDVNSKSSKSGSSIEDTALLTNLEAIEEIALQIQLREISGLIVIDFIDMKDKSNRAKIYDALKKAFHQDKNETNILPISECGLLEMTRQRRHISLNEAIAVPCDKCEGAGSVIGLRHSALQLLRELQFQSVKFTNHTIIFEAPIGIITFILNQKYIQIKQIEHDNNVEILLIPNPEMNLPNFLIQHMPKEDPRLKNFRFGYTSSPNRGLQYLSNDLEKHDIFPKVEPLINNSKINKNLNVKKKSIFSSIFKKNKSKKIRK